MRIGSPEERISSTPVSADCWNLVALLSPSVYYAAGAARVPVVQTLHHSAEAASHATFRGSKESASWLPDEVTARGWQAVIGASK
jgi:hypothetical protein